MVPCAEFDNLPHSACLPIYMRGVHRVHLMIGFVGTNLKTLMLMLSAMMNAAQPNHWCVFAGGSIGCVAWWVVFSERWKEVSYYLMWWCLWFYPTTINRWCYLAMFMNSMAFNIARDKPHEEASNWLCMYSKKVLLVQCPACWISNAVFLFK